MRPGTAWLKFFGMRAGLSKAEMLHTPIGEILDYVACEAIFNGADQKTEADDDPFPDWA